VPTGTHEPVGTGLSVSLPRLRRSSAAQPDPSVEPTPDWCCPAGPDTFDPIMWSGSHTPTTTLQAVGVRRSRDRRQQ